MQELLQKVLDLESKAVAFDTAIAIFKWAGSIFIVYIVGCGYFLYYWTRRFKKDNESRADVFFSHTEKENGRIAQCILELQKEFEETKSLVRELSSEIKHEREIRQQEHDACKERCEIIRCKDDK